ncbi:uncharacterized protein [Dendrobates tinctorius]|uniref:uncharacterized protein n=1 Tax=Dendrobates tinctorius TaxID=92724 RepID=UPI003CC9A261
MSDYSSTKVAGSYVAEPAVNTPMEVNELKKGGQPDENKCDHCEVPHYPSAQKCEFPTIKISNVCSLSKTSFHHNASIASRFKESHLDPAGPNDLKLLSESDVQHIPLDSHSAPKSSNKSDCNVREVEAWLCKNVSSTVDNHKGKNLNKFVTEEGGLSNEPKLPVTPTVSSPASKFSRIETRSTAYAKSTRIETHTQNSDEQKRSDSSVSKIVVPSDNKSKPAAEENIENKSRDKKFCCVLSWTASIYGKQVQCPCALAESTTTPSLGYVPQSSASVKQLAVHIESYSDYVIIKDLDSSKRTVKKETSPRQLKTQRQLKLPLIKRKKNSNGKSLEHVQHDEKTQTSFLRKTSGVGRRKSQALALSEGENSNSTGKQESMLNSVLALQTCGESRANTLNRQEKALLSHGTSKVSDLTPGQKPLTDLNDESEQSMYVSNGGGSPYVHSKPIDFRESSMCEKFSSSIHCQNKGPKANTEQRGQSLPFDQDYLSNWKDKESENLTHLALNKHDINPDSSEDNAVINESDCSNESIDRSLNSMDGSSCVPQSAILLDNTTNDKTMEKIQNNIYGNEFCCMLGWSAQVCGEQSKCSCNLVSPTTNFEMNELTSHISRQSCKVKFPLIKDGFPVTTKKQARSKAQFIPSETIKTPSASRKESHSLGLDKQNISFVETSELSPPRRCRPKRCLFCDNCKQESVQNTLNKHNVKTPKENQCQVVKPSQKLLLDKVKTCLKMSNPDLQTERDSQLEISKHYGCVVKYSNGEFTPLQEPKCNEYEKCGQNLGIEDKLVHDGKLQRQKKRKLHFIGSERLSAIRRKYTPSKQKSLSAGKKPMEMASLPPCDAVEMTPDASSRPNSQSSLQEKINIKQCVVKLYRLPLSLEGKFFLDNPREMIKNCKVKDEADTELREITSKELQ